MPYQAVIAIAVVVGLIVFVGLFRSVWKVAEPNEALIISGLGARTGSSGADSLGFKIVTGKGTSVFPGFQTARRLSLDIRSANLEVTCVTSQGIRVGVRGVVIYKVGDDFVSIANAARRFLDQQQLMDSRIHDVFAGHLRSIVGGLTVEDLIRNRERLTGEVRASSSDEMGKLGLVVDSLQIQEIDDETGYIANLGKPHAAAVQSQARIASAEYDKRATQAEQIAFAEKSAAIRDAQIKQAGFQAEIDQASANAQQSGPLAEATARQQVVVAETKAAELEAAREEQRLLSQVVKPADAEAYRQRTLANAQRDAEIARAEAEARATEVKSQAEAKAVEVRGVGEARSAEARGLADAKASEAKGLAEAKAVEAKGLAEAKAVEAKAMAEAAGIEARAKALAENKDAVIAQQMAENYPSVVAAAAQAFANVDNMVVLNGAEGMEDLLAKVLTMGGAGFGIARQLIDSIGQVPTPQVNGHADGKRAVELGGASQ